MSVQTNRELMTPGGVLLKLKKDVYSPKAGQSLLLKAGRTVTENDKEKLALHGVTDIEKRYKETAKILGQESYNDGFVVLETEAFKEFHKKYKRHYTEFKSLTEEFAFGGDIQLDILLNSLDSFTDGVRVKSDILNYIRFIGQLEDSIFIHSLNVAMLCSLAGKWLKLNQENMHHLILAGILHDIGKLKIDPEILNKKGKLNELEFMEIKKHPMYGYGILKERGGIPNSVLTATLMHHERADGRGYPSGVDNKHIDLITTIVALCDCYEAMTAERSYKDRVTPFNVMKQLEMGECGHMDMSVVQGFVKFLAESFIGNKVKLSNGVFGKIVFLNPQSLTRPLVQINGSEFIDLDKRKDLEILAVF